MMASGATEVAPATGLVVTTCGGELAVAGGEGGAGAAEDEFPPQPTKFNVRTMARMSRTKWVSLPNMVNSFPTSAVGNDDGELRDCSSMGCGIRHKGAFQPLGGGVETDGRTLTPITSTTIGE